MHSHAHIHKKSSDKSILIAFLCNLAFSATEFFGGLAINSAAITADAIHSLGDALSTGIAFVLEFISHRSTIKNPARYSFLGGVIVTIFLTIGSIHLLIEAIERLQEPADVDGGGMIVFAILGAVLNFIAALATHGGESFNQKSVNLHMLEDTFSWIAVLVGAIVMKITGITIIDPILSIGIAIFILYRALANVFFELKKLRSLSRPSC